MINLFNKNKRKGKNKYESSLESLNDDRGNKVYFTIKTKHKNHEGEEVTRIIQLLDNHILKRYMIKGEKVSSYHYYFYGDLRSPYFKKNTLFRKGLDDKYKVLVLKFGTSMLDEICIDYKKESDLEDFLKELKKRYYDYLTRFLDMLK